jgi:hypothetical protein
MTRRVALTAVAAALLLAGCGGTSTSKGGYGGTTPIPSVKSSAFSVQANRICLKIGTQIASLAAPTGNASESTTLDAELPLLRSEVTQLTALTPPAAQLGDWHTVLQELNTVVAIVPQLSSAASADDTTELMLLARKITPITATDTAQLNKLGLGRCAADYEPGGSGSQEGSG